MGSFQTLPNDCLKEEEKEREEEGKVPQNSNL